MKNRIDNIKISSVEYFVMFLMVVSCGFPAGDIIPGKSFVIIGMGLLYLLHNKRRIGHNYKSLITMTLMIIVVYIAHYIQFGIYDNILMLKLLLSISGFFVCLIMGSKFRYAYLNIMAVFAGISLIFFLLQVSLQIVPTIGPLYSGTHFRGVFIWNTQPYAAWRNCGPFWEPGAYAGYLLLVFVLFFNDLKLLWDRHPIKVMIITIAFLTTFSTQGYLTAFLVLMSKLIVSMKGKNASRALMVSFCVLIASFFIYESAPFLREKVDTQIEEWADWDSDESLHYASRFTTTMVDLDIIGKNPFWGASNKAELKYQDFKYIQRVIDSGESYGSGSGMTSFAASNGLIILFVWLLLTYKSLRRYFNEKKVTILLLICLLALGQGEVYLNYIFYLSLPYISMTAVRKKTIFFR